ncbi:MAG: hypothetical protein MUO76_08055 [Anaerolineaceae bacterium]|nr:hypothetical protein [Anaerolineaceae bacterium]
MHLIVDYLGKNSEQFTDLAVFMFHEIVSSGRGLSFTTETRNNAEKILNAAKNADRETKDKAIEIVNIYGERGDYGWRSWLDKLR